MSLINDFLRSMHMRKGSDLHVIAGDPPRMRVHGDLITLDNQRLDPEEPQVRVVRHHVGAVDRAIQQTRLRRLRSRHPGGRALSRQRLPALERRRRRVPRHPLESATLEELKMPKALHELSTGDARSDSRRARRARASRRRSRPSSTRSTRAKKATSSRSRTRSSSCTSASSASSASARWACTARPSRTPCIRRCARIPTRSSSASFATSRP